jgi:methylglyoxal synthase
MNNKKNATATKSIAIVATDNKRTELIEWSYFNKELLTRHQLTACGETAVIIEGTLNTEINKLFTTDTGGYQQLAKLIENGKIDMLFFFAEPVASVEKDLDLKNLLVVAAKQNVVVASNKVTTAMVMASAFPDNGQPVKKRNNPGLLKQAISTLTQLLLKPSLTTV